MNGKKIIKPFDLEAAKNGAKIETRDGREVEILKWDRENYSSYPIEGVILRNKGTWTNDGKWSIEDPYCRHDLVIVEYDGEDKDEKIRKTLVDFFSISAARGEQTNGVDDKDILAWLERQGKKSQDTTSEDNASKVKPKFQVGDLIVEPREGESNGLWHIERIEDGRYWTGSFGVRIEYADKHYHLWSIEDARDGDALAWWLEKQGRKMQEVMWKDFKEKIKVIQRGDRD